MATGDLPDERQALYWAGMKPKRVAHPVTCHPCRQALWEQTERLVEKSGTNSHKRHALPTDTNTFYETMTILQLIAATEAVADTTKKAVIEQKLDMLSHMSAQDLISMLIKDIVNFGLRILIALVLLAVGRWIIRWIRRAMRNMMTRREVDPSLRGFLSSMVNITLTLFLIIIIIGILGIDTTSFIAVFASAGLAVGMALSGTLQNFAGGVMILIFKPFKVGDFIEAQGQSGIRSRKFSCSTP